MITRAFVRDLLAEQARQDGMSEETIKELYAGRWDDYVAALVAHADHLQAITREIAKRRSEHG